MMTSPRRAREVIHDREEQLDHHIGRIRIDQIAQLDRLMKLVGGNVQDLLSHIDLIYSPGEFRYLISEEGRDELTRHLFNYVTASSALRDAQMHVRDTVTSSEDSDLQARYAANLSDAFDLDQSQFVHNLRNYCSHRELPAPIIRVGLKATDPGMSRTIMLDAEALERRGKGFWSAPARRYLQRQDSIDLEELITEHDKSVRVFHEWLVSELSSLSANSRAEYHRKQAELDHWLTEHGRPIILLPISAERPRRKVRREHAERRITRFAHGTEGFTTHTAAPDGQILWIADPWNGLPVRTPYPGPGVGPSITQTRIRHKLPVRHEPRAT